MGYEADLKWAVLDYTQACARAYRGSEQDREAMLAASETLQRKLEPILKERFVIYLRLAGGDRASTNPSAKADYFAQAFLPRAVEEIVLDVGEAFTVALEAEGSSFQSLAFAKQVADDVVNEAVDGLDRFVDEFVTGSRGV